jgi:hypothetical protein
MGKHQSVSCHRGVDLLEERFLLSGGAAALRGLPFAAPAVEVASGAAVDSPEDEPSYSPAAHADDDPPDAGDVVSARSIPTTGARAASEAAQPAGPVAVVLGTVSASTAVVSNTEGGSMALVAGPLGHAPASPVPGFAGGPRPASAVILALDENPLRGWQPDVPHSSPETPADSAARALKAAGVSAVERKPAAGSEAIAPPRGFSLITEALPFARDSLERAIGRFLTRIESLGVGRPAWQESLASWIPWLVLTVAASAGAAGWWRRQGVEDGAEQDKPGRSGRIGRHGLPGLPSPRSTRHPWTSTRWTL